MNKIHKVLACIQILVFFSLTWCSSGITTSLSGKFAEFPCNDHKCGCHSSDDCKTHCCCVPQGSQVTDHHGIKKQKNGLQSFISSLQCKLGSDAVTSINVELKYILEDHFVIPQITFLGFLTSDTLARIREVMVSPPEKPPRCLA